MKKLVLTLSTFLLVLGLYAQTKNDCTCIDMMQELIKNVEENYSLFELKVYASARKKKAYQKFSAALLDIAANTGSRQECQPFLKRYINFFHDGHLWVDFKQDDLPSFQFDRRSPDEMAALYRQQNFTDPLMGVWETNGYKVVIIKERGGELNSRDYTAVILSSENENWKKQQIKMEIFLSGSGKYTYRVNYFMGNGALNETRAYIDENLVLRFPDLSGWRKLYPVPEGHILPDLEDLEQKYVRFESLDTGVFLLKIASFAGFNESAVAETVKRNESLLKQAKLLIIDIRDNPGGNDQTYFPLLSYIYSGTITFPATHFWMSPQNKAYFSQWLTEEDTLSNSLFFQQLQNDTPRYFAPFEDSDLIHELDTLYQKPEQVAIIVNGESASSAETFVFRAMQSNRVTVFGEYTAGVVDGFNGNILDLGCFSLRYPTTVRSMTDLIDPHGIAPDVFIELDYISDQGLWNLIRHFYKESDR